MIKLLVRKANHPDVEFKVDGNLATVGRGAGCDVVVDQPYVSKRHLRVFSGIVVVDLGSSNGTFIDGKRLTEATLVAGADVQLGDGDVFLSLSAPEGEGARTAPAARGAGADVEQLRARCALLESENQRLKEGAQEQADAAVLVEALRRKNEQLAQRVESMKQQVEGHVSADGDSVQAKLALQKIEQTRALNEELQRKLDRARAELDQLRAQAGSSSGARPAELEKRVADHAREIDALRRELEAARGKLAQHDELVDTVRRLREELERSRASAPAVDATARESVARLTQENQALRERLSAAEARGGGPPSAASELFLKLQTENSALRRRANELEARAGSTPAPAAPIEAPPSKLLQEVVELRAQIATLRASSGASSSASAQRAVAAAVPSGDARLRALLTALAHDDVEGRSPMLDGSPEEFLVIEQFRVVRHVERIVTRLAGDFIQLYNANTMLPDVGGNLRELAARVVDASGGPEARRELLDYLAQLSRWLVVSLGANRKAAARFAEKLKTDLSQGALVGDAPISAIKRLSGQSDAELWRRATAYLRELTPDIVEDRLEKLAREAALELMGDAPKSEPMK